MRNSELFFNSKYSGRSPEGLRDRWRLLFFIFSNSHFAPVLFYEYTSTFIIIYPTVCFSQLSNLFVISCSYFLINTVIPFSNCHAVLNFFIYFSSKFCFLNFFFNFEFYITTLIGLFRFILM